MDLIIVFETTHNALAAEVCLQKQHVPFEMLPTPRRITASCGLSLKVSEEYLSDILDRVQSASIRALAIYRQDKHPARKEEEYTEIWRR